MARTAGGKSDAGKGRTGRVAHRSGWQEGLRQVWLRVFTTFYRRVSVLARDLDRAEAGEELPPGYGIEVLSSASLADYLRFRPSAGLQAVAARLALGERCFAVRHGEEIVHAAWTAEGRAWIPYLRREALLGPGEVFVYDSFTAPKYRGAGLASYRSAFMLGFHRGLGAGRAWAVVAHENRPGLRAAVARGYREVGQYACLRLGPWQKVIRWARGQQTLPPLAGPGGASGAGAGGARRYWDQVAGEWATGRPHRLWRQHSDRLLGALLARWWPEAPVERVLKTDLFDEAFGEGAAPFLEGRARSWVGVDVSGMVVRCALAAHPGLRGVGADVRSLPFAGGVFDLVVSPSTLDHFETREEISASLRELWRVLRIGGVLLLTLDNPRNPVLVARRLLPFGLLRRLGLVPYQTGATLGPGELGRALEAAGFDVRHLGAVLHCPRAPAVALARLLERRGSPATRERLLRGLAWFEGLSRYPTRFLTGHFVAALAVKR